MSPASQGNLEVERYIGSNLISSWTRVNNGRNVGKGRKPESNPKASLQRNNERRSYGIGCDCGGYTQPPHHPGRTGYGYTGVPLLSVNGKKKNHQQRNVAVEDERTPLSRLAIHTQGAPLILTSRNPPRKNQPHQRGGSKNVKRSNKYKDNQNQGTSDCLSVASDESSGSSQSENCLPRIIKPRKRRKKDRKPPNPDNRAGDEVRSDDPDPASNFLPCDNKPNSPESGSQSCDENSDNPKLHHSFEDVTESVSYQSSCQCHYCDPSGIWDSSPRTESQFFPNAPTPPSDSKSFHYYPHSDLMLRRSWSEPIQSTPIWRYDSGYPPLRSNSFSEGKSKNWTAGDDLWESLKGCDIKTGLTNVHECSKNDNKVSLNYSNQCLEVSTEIVTSPNGHRDIEIRFYSTSPPA